MLRRTGPLSEWGYERGSPIDRYYIEAFLAEHRGDIRGRALEIKDSTYVRRFDSGVTHIDVLDIDAANASATIVGDLTDARLIADGSFDCIVLTQTLQYVFDTGAAIDELHRMLAPGGVLLATVPGIARVELSQNVTDCWHFTPTGCRILLERRFGPGNVAVRSYGNVAAASSFLFGMAREELTDDELRTHDPHFPVIVAMRARNTYPHDQTPKASG